MHVFRDIEIDEITRALLDGAVVAVPTETVFGLAASINSEEGVKKLIKIKDRGVKSGKVFTLIPENVDSIERYVIAGSKVKELIQRHMPGALTLILPKNPEYHNWYFDNFKEIGIRIPDFPLFSELLPKTGALLLTSANFRGEKTLGSVEEIMEKLPVDGVVNMEPGGDMPSTVARVGSEIEVLRRGSVEIKS